MDLGLDGAVVLITGASGGIGLALADAFAGEGARLVLHAHSRTETLAARIAERSWHERALVVRADVSQDDQVDAAFDAAAARFGRVDHCIANAGIWPAEAHRVDLLPPEQLRRTLDVDLVGALFTARAFFRTLARTGPRPDRPGRSGEGASLTFVGSTAGRFGERGHVDYAAAKAALRGATLTLKNEIVELDPYGRVNLVEPGWTRTEMADDTLRTPGTLERVVATMPLQQIARPEDIARAILFLSSPLAARHVTGEIVTVAGGMEGRLRWTPGDVDPAKILRRVTEGDGREGR